MTTVASWIDPKQRDLDMFQMYATMERNEYISSRKQKLVENLHVVKLAREGLNSGQLEPESVLEWGRKAFEKWVWLPEGTEVKIPRKFTTNFDGLTGVRGRPKKYKDVEPVQDENPPDIIEIDIQTSGTSAVALVRSLWMEERTGHNKPGRPKARLNQTCNVELDLTENFYEQAIDKALENFWTEFGDHDVYYQQASLDSKRFLLARHPAFVYHSGTGTSSADADPSPAHMEDA